MPPIRTKKNPILAGLTIATVRGFLLNFGIYYAVKDAVGAPFAWSPKVAFVARFMTAFASVIAITKDLPDIEGDKVSLGLLCCIVFCCVSFLVWRCFKRIVLLIITHHSHTHTQRNQIKSNQTKLNQIAPGVLNKNICY